MLKLLSSTGYVFGQLNFLAVITSGEQLKEKQDNAKSWAAFMEFAYFSFCVLASTYEFHGRVIQILHN